MKTVGELLKTARERKNISLDEVAKTTKIKRKFLEAIEKDDFGSMPSPTAAIGFIQNYAQFLGLSRRRVLGAFRRDTKPQQEEETLKGIVSRSRESKLKWSPRTTLILVILVAFFFLSFYLAYQYFSLRKNPRLDLIQPQEGEHLKEKQVLVVGKTDPDVVVTVNGSLASLSSGGEFRFYLELLSGENKIVVEATNRIGKKTRAERLVWVVDEKE